MKRIISGLTSTAKLTLGNYLGAIKHLLDAQEDKDIEIYMFLADLHAITLPIFPETLKNNIEEQLKTYLACGIDPKKVKLFKQSEIKGHADFFYFLTTISNEGQLKRMTQFKDKSLKNKNKTEQVPLGLLVYPILMAADILIYNADAVIVGADQKQHLELTRDLAQRLNKKFNLNFNIPEPMIPKTGAKIMALKTPTKKMTKSDSDVNETIFLLDSPEIIRNKIKTCLTDSENKVYYEPESKPGISNLLVIYSLIKNITIEEAENLLKDLNYASFKNEVAEAIVNLLTPIQERYKNLNKLDIKVALEYNREVIQETANDSLLKLKKGFGIK